MKEKEVERLNKLKEFENKLYKEGIKYIAGIEDKNHIVSSLLKYPTFEIAEMFSYAMELIMSNRVKNVFDKENYQKYSFIKIYNKTTTD